MEKDINTSIFYVDDDIDDLEFFKEVIIEINESVTLFEEGAELLNTLNSPPPIASVIFLDLNMPVKSGFDLLKEIKSSPTVESIPVVILTTSINPSDVQMCKKLGANLYIRKPTSISSLRKVVSHVLSIDWNNFNPSDKEFVYQE